VRRESDGKLRQRALRLARKFRREEELRLRGKRRRRDWGRDPDWRAFNKTQRSIIQLLSLYRIRMVSLKPFADQ
jgi:hypothetical protein